jgi:hypothetical protein
MSFDIVYTEPKQVTRNIYTKWGKPIGQETVTLPVGHVIASRNSKESADPHVDKIHKTSDSKVKAVEIN